MSDGAQSGLDREGTQGLSAGQRGRTIRIGLTGPIGCGKSTVAAWLGELGARVINADQVARGVTPPGSPELAAVVEAFGDGILQADATLDRAALARIVFADPVALRRLEAIIHPAVRPPILEQLARAEREGAVAVVIEAIKLVEGGLAALCDEVWLVSCDPAEQRARLIERARARLAGREPERAQVGAVDAGDADADAGAAHAGAAHADAGAAHAGAAHADAGGADADLRAAVPIEARLEADTEARIAAQADLVTRLRPHATRVIDTSGSLAESRSRAFAAWTAAMQRASA